MWPIHLDVYHRGFHNETLETQAVCLNISHMDSMFQLQRRTMWQSPAGCPLHPDHGPPSSCDFSWCCCCPPSGTSVGLLGLLSTLAISFPSERECASYSETCASSRCVLGCWDGNLRPEGGLPKYKPGFWNQEMWTFLLLPLLFQKLYLSIEYFQPFLSAKVLPCWFHSLELPESPFEVSCADIQTHSPLHPGEQGGMLMSLK